MFQKYPPYPNRVRKVPKQFSWVDHRLVRDHYLQRCSHQAAAFYLFLVTVADAKGLSYYADSSIEKILSINSESLHKTRKELIHINLIVYKKPVYQLLPLDCPKSKTIPKKQNIRVFHNKPESIGNIFKKLMEEEAS